MQQYTITPLNNDKPDAEIAISFLCAVIDGFEHPAGSQHKFIKPKLRKLKDFFKEMREKSAILDNQGNPNRINEACANKLHAASWRVYHELERQQSKAHVNDDKVKALSNLRDYCCSAFEQVFKAQSETNLEPATVIDESNKNTPAPIPQAA